MVRIIKRVMAAVLIFSMLLSASACGCKPVEGLVDSDEGFYLYCLDSDEESLIAIPWERPEGTAYEQVENILNALQFVPETKGYVAALPAGIAIKKTALQGAQLQLDFNAVYLKLKGAREVLFRAAYVLTLVQIKGIDQVFMSVDDASVKDLNGEDVGVMSADSFMDNSIASIQNYVKRTFILYYGSSDGRSLVRESRDILYDTNVPVEKAALENLMKEPSRDDMISVIPSETHLLSVSVQDRMCYVNFDEGFLENMEGVSPEVTLYAVVNTVLEASKADRVQILINGESNVMFHDMVNLSETLERNNI